MTRATRLPKYHVLDFYHDKENNCALTILVNQTRYHVVADVDKLRGPVTTQQSQSTTWQEYSRLLSNLKTAGQDEHEDHKDRNQSTDSGVDVRGPHSIKKGSEAKEDPDSPSTNGNDAEHDMCEWLLAPLGTKLGEDALASKKEDVPVQTLQDWYSPRNTLFFSLDVKSGELEAVELASSPDLRDRMARLRPDLPAPVPNYIQAIDVPWYSASDLEVVHCSESPPPFHPSMVRLKISPPNKSGGGGGGAASGGDDDDDDNDQAHQGRMLFFKTVNNADPQPTKREIKLLDQIARKGLHDKIRCPRLVGIVTRDDESSARSGTTTKAREKNGAASIMGFLQTPIPGPTPLTEKFDSATYPQEQREEWARRADEMKNVLHENGIIWGDAKGDNFVVDEAGELWIIDFGGSYTEGWVDPEVVETKEGDDMGVDKVVNALRDPEKNVIGDGARSETQQGGNGQREEDEEEDPGQQDNKSVVTGDKRKRRHAREEDVEKDDGSKQDTKRRRRSPDNTQPSAGTATENATMYCYCGGRSAGTMIGCDGEDCEREWFHLECTNLKSLPEEEEAWFCRDCSAV